MIHSMTAFARHSSQHPWGSLIWEIRSVNHRYLEPSFKLPEALRQIEFKLRESMRRDLSRGKVECGLRFQTHDNNHSGALTINDNALSALIENAEKIQRKLAEPAPINPLDLLQWPGVLADSQLDEETICRDAVTEFNNALKQLQSSREREGAALKVFIEQRLTSIEEITESVKQQLPTILQAQRSKLQERLSQLQGELDSDRLEQEMVILAQKSDVNEEMDRLGAHVNEVRRVINKGGACGRRLDFLMQELNREANTLSSKSIVSDTTQAAVELKVLIEQMREQIQNIE